MYKVKISVGDLPYTGYINIDPVPQIEESKLSEYTILVGNPSDLSQIEDGSCDEIIVRQFVEHLNTNNLFSTLTAWAKKLRRNGEIIISGTDFFTLMSLYKNGQLTLSETNAILFGEQKRAWDSKSLCVNISDITDILSSAGLKIISKQIEGFIYIIKAKRV
jgi:predicted SAM-dependent methyltransferase